MILLLFSCGAKKVAPPSRPSGYPKPYKALGKWYQPLLHAKDFTQRGIASWYGRKFHGRKTSNGEIYDMHAMTAAHKTLPLGTYVRVKNLKNKNEIRVRINDRGPFVRGRIIDLSYLGAQKIGIVGPGTAPVEIVALGAMIAPASTKKPSGVYMPMDYYTGTFSIQVGAFTQRSNAEGLKTTLDKKFKNAHITVYNTGKEIFYRVRVGLCTTLEQADQYETIMIKEGFKDAFAVAEDH
ncbi:septal ring lytic transglycosylase RlpA family protein [Thermodesulfobacteriota bacterium]